MKTKHTYETWKYEEETKTIRSIPSNYWICTMDSWDGAVNNEANAKLIAAAPELLNCCDAVLTAWHSKISNMHKREPAYLQQIRDAINKATL